MLNTPEFITLELDPSRVRNIEEIKVLTGFGLNTRGICPVHAFGDGFSLKTIFFSTVRRAELVGIHANWPALALYADADRDGYHELRRALSCLGRDKS